MKYKIMCCPFNQIGTIDERWLVAYNGTILRTKLVKEQRMDNIRGCLARRIVNEANAYELEKFGGKADRFHFRMEKQ